MHLIASSITNPSKFLEFPFLLLDAMSTFMSVIIQQSFSFASQVGRMVV